MGGKGANLAEMSRIGLPVPAGFTITTEVCNHYSSHGGKYPAGLDKEVAKGVAFIEKAMGKEFGSRENPLLVSVRSGARDSMPGMMDTILNLGLNDETTGSLARKSGNPRFAWDCYRRFLQMYGDVVMGVQRRAGEHHEPFEEVIDHLKSERGAKSDLDLDVEGLKELVKRFKRLIKDRTGREFPADPKDQLWGAIGAVFNSWNNDRAVVYRRKYGIPHSWGTAVNVQAMVYGNMGETSATGVAFTRDPATGGLGNAGIGRGDGGGNLGRVDARQHRAPAHAIAGVHGELEDATGHLRGQGGLAHGLDGGLGDDRGDDRACLDADGGKLRTHPAGSDGQQAQDKDSQETGRNGEHDRLHKNKYILILKAVKEYPSRTARDSTTAGRSDASHDPADTAAAPRIARAVGSGLSPGSRARSRPSRRPPGRPRPRRSRG